MSARRQRSFLGSLRVSKLCTVRSAGRGKGKRNVKGKWERRNGKRKEGNAVGKSALAAKEVCQACAMTWPSPNSEPAAAASAPCQRQVRVERGWGVALRLLW